jgi:hypothetical protein
MEILEQIYLENPKKFYIHERKSKISQGNTIVQGPHKSGVTHLVLQRLFELKKDEFLYIDYNDIRTPSDISFEKCIDFCKTKNLKLLAIENSTFTPFVVSDIDVIYSTKRNISCENFEQIRVLGLDFEEFIAFSQKEVNEPSHIFSLFLKDGNLPQKVGKNEFTKLTLTQQTIQSISDILAKRNLFRFLCQNATLKLTFLQVYNSMKSGLKISKDSVYKFIFELEDDGAIFFVEKFGQKNGAKKIYIYDFSMISAVTYKKEPIKVFENMVFLELIKYNQEIYYDDGIDFLIAEASRAIIVKAFPTRDSISSVMPKLIRRLQIYEISILEIVTMNAEFVFEHEGITVEALPFWIWALKD